MLDITDMSLQTAVIPDALSTRISGAQRTNNYGIRPVGALLAEHWGQRSGYGPRPGSPRYGVLWVPGGTAAGASGGGIWA